jgi:hypothetical protein
LRLRAGAISWYVPNSKIKNNRFGALFRYRDIKRSFDFGTSQLIVPALYIKTLKKIIRLRATFFKKGAFLQGYFLVSLNWPISPDIFIFFETRI